MFEGKCVNTIVLTKPIRPANLVASRAENPANRFAPKKMPPIGAGCTLYRSQNHYATKLCTTNPPANASIACSPASWSTIPRER